MVFNGDRVGDGDSDVPVGFQQAPELARMRARGGRAAGKKGTLHTIQMEKNMHTSRRKCT